MQAGDILALQMDASTRERIAALAAEWAAEVAPRVHAIAPNGHGTVLEKFVHHLRDRDVQGELTVMFYLAVEEAGSQSAPWRPSPTNFEEGDTQHIGRLIRWIIGMTQTVAAPFQLQRQAIPEDFVCLADEVALDFKFALEWFLPERGFVHGLLMDRQLAGLIRVDKWLDSFSGRRNEGLWTEVALQRAPQWARARELAKEALAAFGIELRT